MPIIKLTNAELLKDLTTVKNGETFFDLHNEYTCIDIDYNLHAKTLGFLFDPRVSNINNNKLYLLFEDVTLSLFKLYLKRTADSCILDSFYRGRFQIDDKLYEYSAAGEGYFYIEFIEGDSFGFFAGKVTFSDKTNPN